MERKKVGPMQEPACGLGCQGSLDSVGPTFRGGWIITGTEVLGVLAGLSTCFPGLNISHQP